MEESIEEPNNSLIDSIKSIILASRKKIIKTVNKQLIETYWNIGEVIVKNEEKKGQLYFEGNDQLKTNTALQMRNAGIEFKTI